MNLSNNNKTQINRRFIDNEIRYKIVDEICSETNLYAILGVERSCTSEELRRAYINRSRICHPDKFPEYPKATEAFQKLAYSYETLNKPSSRHAYDISGTIDLDGVNGNGDETLHSVLYQLFLEFMDGDFEKIRSLVNALNEGNPGLDLGEDAIEILETAFRRMRELLLVQQQLRNLRFFNVFGRFKLSLQLTRIAFTIPLLIDNAMKSEIDHKELNSNNKGILSDNMVNIISGFISLLDNLEQRI
ncbi:7944_t:CDS:2 [Diversispora eburnea]|uniref:7944_t:CDS:1 n=1 Tax=Diversispora eburnea TaxID=1213867 RepID=A0A9N9GGU1_9GLOM|nr:7944_t:CDS:2 [Diversispora eburnea]